MTDSVLKETIRVRNRIGWFKYFEIAFFMDSFHIDFGPQMKFLIKPFSFVFLGYVRLK